MQPSTDLLDELTGLAGSSFTWVQSVPGILSGIVGLALILGAIYVFICLLWGGWQWLNAGDDTAAVQKAKDRLTQCLVGFSVLALTYAAALLVQYFLGINVFQGLPGGAPGGVPPSGGGGPAPTVAPPDYGSYPDCPADGNCGTCASCLSVIIPGTGTVNKCVPNEGGKCQLGGDACLEGTCTGTSCGQPVMNICTGQPCPACGEGSGPTATPTVNPALAAITGSVFAQRSSGEPIDLIGARVWAVSGTGQTYETKATTGGFAGSAFTIINLPSGAYTVYSEYVLIASSLDYTQVEYYSFLGQAVSVTNQPVNVGTLVLNRATLSCAAYCQSWGAGGAICAADSSGSIVAPPLGTTNCSANSAAPICTCTTNLPGVEVKPNYASGKCDQICSASGKSCVGNGTDSNGGNNKIWTKISATNNTCIERDLTVCGSSLSSIGLTCGGHPALWSNCRCI